MTRLTIPDHDETVVPLHVEEASVALQEVERGGVRVRVQTTTREHPIDEDLTLECVEIDRVAIGRPIDAVPPVREEGDTMVISVVEEFVVVEHRLILKEEIRLRRVRKTKRHRESVILREQEAVIERTEPSVQAGVLPIEPPAVTQSPPIKEPNG